MAKDLDIFMSMTILEESVEIGLAIIYVIPINNDSIFAEFHMGVGGPLEAVTASAPKLLHRQVTQRMLQRRLTKLTMLSLPREKQPHFSSPGLNLSQDLTVNAAPPALPYQMRN